MKRKPLTRDAILDAALGVIDREGLAALSMRKVGAVLGVEAMSLYNHVASKDALLDGVHERILLSLDDAPPTRSWQTLVRHQARALHRALRSHPHAIPLFATRPAATPAAIARLDRYLQVLIDAGFEPLDALSVVQLVAQLVVGHAMWTSAVEVVSITPASLDARELARWDGDRELAMGIDALIHGFERLL